ncbi:hypothetical protein ABT061_15930 [Streptosporangium sp. NPDC002544]|uniref:hypothetical protein n=1 Tax=Streptosporangium sp. NPDC002544 TaxID=3154538 RepID=UPI003325FD9D
MCQEVRVTAGAMLMSALCTRVGGGLALVAGSAAALYAVAGGSTITAWVLLGLTAYSALTTILLLVRRANPMRPAAAAAPMRAPARTQVARVLETRPAPALPAAPATQVTTTYTSAHRSA